MRLQTSLPAAAVAVAMALPGAAQAATRTIDFTVDGFSVYNYSGADFFAELGFGTTGTISVSGSFSFDTDAAPLAGPYSYSSNDRVYLPYQSFTVEISDGTDSRTLTGAASTSTSDRIIVRDGKSTSDYFQVSSSTDQGFSSGYDLDYFYFQSYGASNTFSGLDVPTVSELNSLPYPFFNVRIDEVDGGGVADLYGQDVTFSKSSAVIPLPAGLPLLLSGLAGLVWLRRRAA